MGDPVATVGIDREAILHQRRKQAMVSLLSQFERDIEPRLKGQDRRAIDDFKRSCREKLNALTWESIELMRDAVSEINEHAVDLAAQYGFPSDSE